MACEQRIERQQRVWTWCRGWLGIPYPCRRLRTRIWYHYDFSQTRYVPSWFPFWQIREGCCDGVIYRWIRRVWWNTPKPTNWSYVELALEFSYKLERRGACPPRHEGEVVL